MRCLMHLAQPHGGNGHFGPSVSSLCSFTILIVAWYKCHLECHHTVSACICLHFRCACSIQQCEVYISLHHLLHSTLHAIHAYYHCCPLYFSLQQKVSPVHTYLEKAKLVISRMNSIKQTRNDILGLWLLLVCWMDWYLFCNYFLHIDGMEGIFNPPH